MLGEVAHLAVHEVGARGAVHPHHVHGEALQGGQGRLLVRAHEHRPRGLKGHLDLEGHLPAHLGHGLPHRQDGAAHLEDVLGGLQEDEVHPALKKPPCRLLVGPVERVPGDLAQGDELGARAQGPRHEGPVGVGGLPGDPGPEEGELLRRLLQAVLGEDVAQGPEGVGLYDLGPGPR